MNSVMELYELGFALDEIILFLDTHPDDVEALADYREISRRYAEAVKEYEKTCAPLTADCVNSSKYWLWVNSPWPWEGGCLCGTMKSDCSTR